MKRPLSLATLTFLLTCIAAVSANAQSRFLVVLNENSNNSDSRRSVTYFDADDFDSGPLFSVFLGFEIPGNFEDPDTLAVDPATGDVYVTAFDSGAAGTEITDTNGDIDIYKIPFNTVFSHWQSNFQGQDVRTLTGPLAVGGSAPTVDDTGAGGGGGAQYANASNLDYVTYGRLNDTANPSPGALFSPFHANTFGLAGSIEKIGEVKRNNGGNFYEFSLDFVDEDTLFFMDESIATTATDTAVTDHTYRLLNRVSTSPGLASNYSGNDYFDGGYNAGTTESWESTRLGLVNSDFAAGLPIGHSEPESSAYYTNGTVRGVWVTESDSTATTGGDDIMFLDLNASTPSNHTAGDLGLAIYRPISGFGASSFALDNDPSVSTSSNDGRADNIFVDSNGDLIIVESGFGDSAIPAIGAEQQPGVFRIPIDTYDNGSGEIVLGTPGPKFLLDGDAGFQRSTGDNSFLERGTWSTFDPITNNVYIVNPGSNEASSGGGDVDEDPWFGMDIWSINVDTGVVESFLDLDESVAMFLTATFGDTVDFFTISEGVEGDFDGDGDVDGRDFLAWQRGASPSPFSPADLATWQTAYNGGLLSAVSSVPEPSSVFLIAMALGLVPCSRRVRV